MTRRLKIAIAATLFLIVYWIVASYLLSPPPAAYHAPPLTSEERQYINERYKYHGITSSVYDGVTGQRYFLRDGEHCKL